MACCEKCWEDAYGMMRYTGRPQTECYSQILELRKNRGAVCTERERAGQFWDEEKKCDVRVDN